MKGWLPADPEPQQEFPVQDLVVEACVLPVVCQAMLVWVVFHILAFPYLTYLTTQDGWCHQHFAKSLYRILLAVQVMALASLSQQVQLASLDFQE
jgi:hypothetical protein